MNTSPNMKSLAIIGTRGIPARYGGFETFAEKLALHLVNRGWDVTVYCQELAATAAGGTQSYRSTWNGINRIHIPVIQADPLGSVVFDWRAAMHVRRSEAVVLTLGYNTAIFNAFQTLSGQSNVTNMDGIEWKRQKWGNLAKAWFWLNEYAATLFSDHLVADHPAIVQHLRRPGIRLKREITMIPYGAEELSAADEGLLRSFDVRPGEFSTVIARPEKENSVLEIVSAFSSRRRNHKLLVLGDYALEENEYHRRVRSAASDEVLFTGAIYDKSIVSALRYFSRLYVHGHTVGGTNPSLVEAMGAGCAVLAHDNKFNRWVAGSGAAYFDTAEECSSSFDDLLTGGDAEVAKMKQFSRSRFRESFMWDGILTQYETLLEQYLPRSLVTANLTSPRRAE